jgi:hypothetical protein
VKQSNIATNVSRETIQVKMFHVKQINKKGGQQMSNNLINIIGNVGFPIAVTCYLLVRFESRLLELTTAINKLTINVEKMKGGDDK